VRLFRRKPADPAPSLRLLSRPGCHLCETLLEVAAPVVAGRGGTLTLVNVDEDAELAARWGAEIPVILDDEGRVVAKAKDSADRIRRRLE
jgi:thioredoxin-like negative regulator of GroEL